MNRKRNINMAMTEADVDTRIAAAMAATAPNINAVSVKLPMFWTARPEVWFAQCEAQFATRQINVELTKFNHIVAALDNATAAEVERFILQPDNTTPYTNLKEALIGAFGKTQVEKDQELLNLNGLGDRRPTALLRYIESLNSDPATLKRALFLGQLPLEVRRVLAAQNTININELAEQADRVMEAGRDNTFNGINAIKRRPKIPSSATMELCFYHNKFGENARKCGRKGCSMSRLVLDETSVSGNGQADR